MSVTVIKPPQALPVQRIKGVVPNSIFLAGSIEQGSAENWQERITQRAIERSGKYKNFTFFNPRRDDWDPTWTQSIDNPQFNEQVNWELNALDCAEKIFMYFDPNTKSPISLLELGLYASSGKIIVCCPEGFWRKGNVQIVCQRYGISCYDRIDVALMSILE